MRLQDGIHPVYPDDLPRVLEVWEASVRATHHFLSEADIQFFKPLVREALRDLVGLACVRDQAGTVVAFMRVTAGEIAALFVHPAWRGRGVGRCLITYAVEGCGATVVDVNEQNAQAVGFYRWMGFEVVGHSAVDGLGKPFPLLHMRLHRLAEDDTASDAVQAPDR
jgi:putative acetyltransferase